MTIANEPAVTTQAGSPERYYNYAYLDEQTKRMIRRAVLKAVAIPGYQVPFGSREMPLPYGWGTGGIQLTAALIGPEDVLKVIDQGSDDTVNAVNLTDTADMTGRTVQTGAGNDRIAAGSGNNYLFPGAGNDTI